LTASDANASGSRPSYAQASCTAGRAAFITGQLPVRTGLTTVGTPMDGRKDNKGQPFDASKRYMMHFDKGQQPPVKAFWSISMYHITDGSFVANPINRYSIGDRTPGLVTNPDGSLDIFIQHNPPRTQSRRQTGYPLPRVVST